MRRIASMAIMMALVAAVSVPAGAQGQSPRVDVRTMENPIDLYDSVWIEELTMIEVRDLIAEGKTRALILTGGIEQNGPYLATGKHNYVLQAMGESIARQMGETLIAPIVTLEPGNPEREGISPGTVYLSRGTYKAVLKDMATSLKNQGFTDVFIMGDSGGNQTPMREVTEELTAAWAGQTARVYFIPEYYNYGDVQTFMEEELGIHEVSEGLHDDYYISSIMMNADLNSVRTNERIKAGKFTINGVSLAPVDKTLANGRRIIQFRTDATTAAMWRAMSEARSSSQQ
jgi:creatinine amidohydrolase